MNFKKFFIFLILLQISSCRWIGGAGTPLFGSLSVKVPDGTPVFKQGFKDGCESVLYARGNQLYRHRYSYKYDPKMIDNTEYRFGRNRGYNFCFFEVVGGDAMTSFDRYILPYGNGIGVFDMSAGDINNNWGGFFGGGADTWGVANSTSGGFDSLFKTWSGGGGGSVFGANPLWAGGSEGQLFGQ